MTIDEIMEALRAIVDGAQGRELTDEEVQRYEQLEMELTTARRSHEVRSRQAAYETPVAPSVAAVAYTATVGDDDTLDRAFDAYLRTGQGNADLTQLRAQSEGVSTAGGYTVPAGFRQKLVEVRAAYGGLATAAETFTTSTGNNVDYPSINDTANSGDITAEGAAVATGADLTFGTVNIGAYKYTSAGGTANTPVQVSIELLQDSAFDVAALVARLLGKRIARAQAAHFQTGTGVGEPQGLLNSALTQDVDLDTADTLTYADFVDLEDGLDPEYEDNASWILSKNTWGQARAIVDSNGRPIVQLSTDGIGQRVPKMLLGYPVIIDQQAPTLSSAGITYPIALGDFREAYVIRRVGPTVVVVDPYSNAANGQVRYHAYERADGRIQNRSAYEILRNNT